MNRFERGYRAALADVTALLRLYGDENMAICGDNILLDPLLSGEPFTPENIKRSADHGVSSTIHSAQYHASEHLIVAIEAMPRRAS
ncbi:hypothetical protein H5J25_13685 [Sphingomonas aliaeris]|uniref:Uncharacterized protein n=1 Tax=Sphingomonas aliaeris TaxID=2759526 RepID=A0A974S3J9_9SPHN|nr:hypothetical protein [Sphingomonas aliaeris]QQV76496.1 hypothetical protein H5J25_13685 [Sphingomonas aliaeris]